MFNFPPFGLDQTVGHWLQLWHPAGLTWTMKLISVIGAPEALAPLGVILAIYAFYRHSPSRSALILMLTAGNILTPLLKHFFSRPRPTADQLRVLIIERDYSFPSGHAVGIVIFAAVVIVFCWNYFRQRIRWWSLLGLAIMILLVGLSRLYLGVHWLTDVLAGYVVGGLWVAITFGALGSALKIPNRDQITKPPA